MKQRIITAVVAAALFLPIVYFGGIPFVILVYLLATVGLYELFSMHKQSLFSIPGLLAALLLWVILIPGGHDSLTDALPFTKSELGIVFVLLLLAYTVITKNHYTFEDAAFSAFAAAYIGIGFYFFIETRLTGGLVYIFYSLFLIWATDSGAYFIGKSIGKKKLWPEISPNKTVEGSIGGIVCAMVVGALFAIFSEIPTNFFSLLAITVVLSIFGQIGDLVESAFKRHFNVKDSGNILPGHGGILDRFDSLLFVFPLLHFFHLF